jgi:hypothetical protein
MLIPVSLGARGRKVVWAAGFVVAAVGLQLLRQRGYRTWNTVWAEDGFVYAADAYQHPALSTLFRGYAGYAQFVPRALILPARSLPVDALGVYCAVVSAAVWALLALFVFRSSAGWIESRRLRALLAVLLVAAPTAFHEVNANLANLGWPLLYAAGWAVVSRRTSAGDVGLRAAVVALAVLTTPVTFVLVPVAVVVTIVRRSRGDVIVAAAVSVGALVQLVAINASGPVPPFSAFSASDVPVAYGVRVVASDVVGERWLPKLWIHLDVVVVAAAVLVLCAFVVVAGPRRIERARWLAALAVALGSVVVFTGSLWARGTGGIRLVSDAYNASDSRYVVVPALLLTTAIVLLADASPRRWLCRAVAVQVVALVVISYALVSPRSAGPPWSPAVDRAAAVCRDPSMTIAKVPVSPDPLTMDVPCDRLR